VFAIDSRGLGRESGFLADSQDADAASLVCSSSARSAAATAHARPVIRHRPVAGGARHDSSGHKPATPVCTIEAMIESPTRSDAARLTDEELLEKFQGFGLEVDRAELERLCEGVLSVEEVAQPLLDRCDAGAKQGRPHEDWIWLCLLELWRRWWPERVCVEFLGDKIEAGYDALERQEAASAAANWLDAWSDVVRLCDLAGIDSIREFDGRFSMYQSLFNWSQDLEDALWNAGIEDPEFLACEDRSVRRGAPAVPKRGRPDGREPPSGGGRVVLRTRRGR
jgi:hypothetical protein